MGSESRGDGLGAHGHVAVLSAGGSRRGHWEEPARLQGKAQNSHENCFQGAASAARGISVADYPRITLNFLRKVRQASNSSSASGLIV